VIKVILADDSGNETNCSFKIF